MKYFLPLLLILIMLMPVASFAQREPGRLYAGVMLHDLNDIGLSVLYSFGPAKYVGIGAGVEVTSYLGNTLIPVYADLRFRHQFGIIEPFIGAQAGRPALSGRAKMSDGTNFRGTERVMGEFFYGGIGGASFQFKKVGVFASYGYRQYRYRYYERGQDGYIETPGSSIVTVGITI